MEVFKSILEGDLPLGLQLTVLTIGLSPNVAVSDENAPGKIKRAAVGVPQLGQALKT